MQSYKMFTACKAFIRYEGKVLVIRESAEYEDATRVGKFDVPGGRVKPGERFDAGLAREIKEETGLDVVMGQPVFVEEWRPVVRGEQWHIVGIFFACEANSDQVELGKEHSEFLWIDPSRHADIDLIPINHQAFDAYVQHVA